MHKEYIRRTRRDVTGRTYARMPATLRLRGVRIAPGASAESHCTLVTQCSLDRLDRLVALARHWPGTYVAAVLAFDGSTGRRVPIRVAQEQVRSAAARIATTPRDGSVRIALVEESGRANGGELGRLYPINALRNLALGLATSELTISLDVDFLPSAGLHAHIQGSYEALRRLCVEQRRLLVLPAFESRVRLRPPRTLPVAPPSSTARLHGLPSLIRTPHQPGMGSG